MKYKIIIDLESVEYEVEAVNVRAAQATAIRKFEKEYKGVSQTIEYWVGDTEEYEEIEE